MGSPQRLERIDDPGDFRRFSRVGDGSAESQRLITATGRQRELAAGRLDALLPGFDALGRADRCGVDTPMVLALAPGVLELLDAPRHIDTYLFQGDLSSDRGNVVDDETHRGTPVRPELQSHRVGPCATVNLDPYAAVQELRDNRTIVLNDAQSRLGPLASDLCDDVAVVFRSHVQMNSYVSFGEAPGFGVHWDDHDVVIIQVAGRKYWEIEAPTELGAVKDVTPRGGSGDVVWSGVVTPGQALAIPRGWAHSVQGLDEEISVHLTVSIGRPNALGLLGQLPPQVLDDGGPFDAEKLDHAYASWCARLASYPRNGPIELIAAQADGYHGYECRVVLTGGVVFDQGDAAGSTLALAGPAGPFEIPRPWAEGLAFGLEHEWWTVDLLSDAAGMDREDVVALVDLLGRAGLIQLRSAG